MNEIPYLMRGLNLLPSESSILQSSSKYLNCAPLREWMAMIAFRRNGPDVPPQVEMHQLMEILDSLRDYGKLEEMISLERKVNPRFDAWFEEGFISSYTLDDFKDYAPETFGGIFYRQLVDGGYEVQIYPWVKPNTQFEFFALRITQTHDLEHIICGGGFDFMGELVPYWARLTNLPKHIKNPELAAELNIVNLLGSLRYTIRTMLHYPEVWPTCVECIQRGAIVGQQSGPFFMAKFESVFHLPVEEARKVLDVHGAQDIDTSREGAIWAERQPTGGGRSANPALDKVVNR